MQPEQAFSVHPIAAVQFEWSQLWREPELDIVKAARRLAVGLVPYSPLGRGLLTATLDAASIDASDFRRSDARFHGNALARNLRQIEALRGVAADLDVSVGQLAPAWLLAQGADVVPMPGSRQAARVRENALAADVTLSEVDLRRMDEAAPTTGWAGARTSFSAAGTSRYRGRPPA